MQRYLVFVLAAVPAFGLTSPTPTVDCRALDAMADTAGTIIPDVGSGRAVVGRRRVPVYSAPDRTCPIVGVFIVRGDELYAQREYYGFTRVAIVPIRPTSGNDIIAWVRTARITANGKGIVPGTHTFWGSRGDAASHARPDVAIPAAQESPTPLGHEQAGG